MQSVAFHRRVAVLLGVLLAATWWVQHAATVPVQDAGRITLATAVLVMVLSPLPVYWHEKQRFALRESSLMVLWAVVFTATLPLSIGAVARVGGPLQDARFARMDAWFHVSVPALATWASGHVAGRAINAVYRLVVPMLALGVFVPGFTGQWRRARIFVVANVFAFFIGLPLFAMFPAVGPWYESALHATAAQLQCQESLLAWRGSSLPAEVVGVVCFPSFHVIWAVLGAYALSGFRWMRVPAVVLGGMIVLSTMTAGWHYFVDVLAGLAVAAVSLATARAMSFPEEVLRAEVVAQQAIC